MKQTILTVAVMLSFAFSCCDDGATAKANTCGVSDPMEDLHWMSGLKASLTNCSCEMSIIRGRYMDKTVFFVALTDPLCDGIDTPTLYECNGNVVRSFTDAPADQKEFYEKVSWDEVLYRCKS